MSDARTVSLKTQKRRQAVKIAGFLTVVAVLTVGVFIGVHRELVEYRRGLQALARGAVDEAVSHLEYAVTHGAKVAQARAALGEAYLKLGRPRDALAMYESLAHDAPANPYYRDTIAGLYQTLGEPERAMAFYEARGPRERLDAADLVRLGDLQQQVGKFDEAIATYRLATQRGATADVFARLGIVLCWRGRLAEGEQALARAVELAPQHRLARIYLARAAVQNGRFADAVDHYRKVLPP